MNKISRIRVSRYRKKIQLIRYWIFIISLTRQKTYLLIEI
nr:MAG TPA: hypothetical protein [Caudoviricetes sp.]